MPLFGSGVGAAVGEFTFTNSNDMIQIEIKTLGRKEILRLLDGIKRNMSNLSPLFQKWRAIWVDITDKRFNAYGEWPGGDRWADLSPASSVPIREYRDLIRLKPKKFGGKNPLDIFRTSSSEPRYQDSWRNAQMAEEQTNAANQGQEARMTLTNTHVATVNEERRDAKGCFKGHPVPARPWAWIEGDEELLQALMLSFHQHIWDGVDDEMKNQIVA
jgi:hypothetical protein